MRLTTNKRGKITAYRLANIRIERQESFDHTIADHQYILFVDLTDDSGVVRAVASCDASESEVEELIARIESLRLDDMLRQQQQQHKGD